MTTTQESVKPGPGPVAAILAFAIFMALLIGTYMAFQSNPGGGVQVGDAGTASRIEQVAVMSESREVSKAPDFRRAEVAAIMGHGVLDLREAEIQGREAVVEAFVLMGHATIRIPEDWKVVTKEVVLMGALHNRTRPEGADPEKRLRIEGLVVMGAITVSH
jgi:hypothetical protein